MKECEHCGAMDARPFDGCPLCLDPQTGAPPHLCLPCVLDHVPDVLSDIADGILGGEYYLNERWP